YLEELVEAELHVIVRRAPTEGWNEARMHVRAVDVASCPNDRSRVQKGADPRLYVISDKGAKLHLTSIGIAPIRRPEANRAIIVLQVTICSLSAEIHPSSEVRMADVAIMLFVHVPHT